MRASSTGRRAPVDGVDTAITAVVGQLEAVCRQMATETPEGRTALYPELVRLTEAKRDLLVERDRVIREFFYGRRR